MRNQAESIQDSAPGVSPCAPWRVTEVQPLTGHRLFVRFMDGTTGEVDLTWLVMSDKAGVFVALRDPSLFSKVYLEYGVVMWPGEIDLAPDAMYDEIKQHGHWCPE